MSKKVLKTAFLSIFALLALQSVSAISVDRSEIQSAGDTEIVFRNYSGPHSVINTVEQIRAIGSGIGRQVSANPGRTGLVGDAGRYAVIHAVDPSTSGRFDADIFIIGRGATVDHITNVRRIISAYLVSAYGYSVRDADTIATFVTVYNAVYRGNLEYFKSRYKEIVTGNLSQPIVGLSTNYEDWPGNTQIVIPLSDLSGGLGTVDTSLISDKDVIKSMQDEDDKGIDARKDMVDIKEREADEAQAKADEAQARADEEKAKLSDEQRKKAEADEAAAKAKADADKKAADAAKAKADADKKTADAAKAKADADKKAADAAKAKADADAAKKNADQADKAAKARPDDADAQKKAGDARSEADKAQSDADAAQKDAGDARSEADKAQSDADESQKAADEQEQKTDEQARNAQDAQNAADKAQAKADQKRGEAQDERTSIAKDQQELIAKSQKDDGNIMHGLRNIDEAGTNSVIVRMNAQTGAVVKESPVNVIRGRTVYEDGDRFIAVAGTNAGNGAVRLIAIDKKTLEIAEESADKLSESSFLAQKDGSYYCTIQDGNDCYIGKFSGRAERQQMSQVKVKAATPITVTPKGIIVTGADGTPVILNPGDLSSVSESQSGGKSVVQRP